jgi:hypothetical protein
LRGGPSPSSSQGEAMARICNGNHAAKAYYHEHRCECACGCKHDTVGYAFCVPCSFNEACGDLRRAGKRAPHALTSEERRHGRIKVKP